MSPAHVLEPTYRRLKRDLMEGAFPMGSKLEALRLADEFGVSMTPVRDSLNQLTGEGLVEFRPGDGFRVPRLTDQGLRDMLNVNHLLLSHALGVLGTGRLARSEALPETDEYAARLRAIFGSIASVSRNKFLIRTVEQIGEKLNPTRKMEPEVIQSSPATLNRLETSYGKFGKECILALTDYHVACVEAVPLLIASVSDSR